MTGIYEEVVGGVLHEGHVSVILRGVNMAACTCGWKGRTFASYVDAEEEGHAHLCRARQRQAQQERVAANDEANRLWAGLMDDARLADMIDLAFAPEEMRSFSMSERRALIGEAARRLRLPRFALEEG